MESSYVIILLEIIVVLIISRIKVPGLWADKFITAFIGSIPAMAVIGLLAWLFFFKIIGPSFIYVLTLEDVDRVSRLAEDLNSNPVGMAVLSTLRFIDHHPISALAFGPLLTVIFETSFALEKLWTGELWGRKLSDSEIQEQWDRTIKRREQTEEMQRKSKQKRKGCMYRFGHWLGNCYNRIR